MLTVTGYNKDTNTPLGLPGCSSDSALASGNQKLLDHGIAIMILDDRGTGASEGRWDSWGQRTQDDYAEVLDWIQAQKWSNGKVGMNAGGLGELTGLVKATLYAELTSAKDATLVAVLSDVDPATAKSTQVTAGFLLASQRAVDRRKSWYSPKRQLIRPWHPFTRASQQPVVPNEANEFQIEIYPTSQVFKKGHQIRLTIGTADTPARRPRYRTC